MAVLAVEEVLVLHDSANQHQWIGVTFECVTPSTLNVPNATAKLCVTPPPPQRTHTHTHTHTHTQFCWGFYSRIEAVTLARC
jgi:hypothetical protein